jgi:ADP-dependent NAD(P)H-hydrate dehydratase / NAD(P)H-hydrate epimerase
MKFTPNLELAEKLLSKASATDNKYSRGVVGFITGSSLYPGAALLGIRAAHELAIGMVCYQGPEDLSDLVLINRPETILGLAKANVIVMGSGVSDQESGVQRQNLIAASRLGIPLVIDAGALQIIEFSSLANTAILTPHAGEALKLMTKLGSVVTKEDIANEPEVFAQELSQLTRQAVLLKGSMSVLAIPGSESVLSGPGSVHLATAGTGDVLAGMIGALAARFVAQGQTLTHEAFRDIALIGLQLHSKAADVAAGRGEFGASAVVAAISEATA